MSKKRIPLEQLIPSKVDSFIRTCKSQNAIEKQVENLINDHDLDEDNPEQLVQVFMNLSISKSDVVASYLKYLTSYLLATKELLRIPQHLQSFIIYTIVFLTHQSVELLLKFLTLSADLFCNNDLLKQVLPININELELNTHDIVDCFERIEVREWLGIVMDDGDYYRKELVDKYNELRSLAQMGLIAEEARFPTKRERYVPVDAVTMQIDHQAIVQKCQEITTILEEIIQAHISNEEDLAKKIVVDLRCRHNLSIHGSEKNSEDE